MEPRRGRSSLEAFALANPSSVPLSDRRGEALVYDPVLKFAFDVMDLVSELCDFHVRLRIPRPNFHHGLRPLLTAEMRELFARHKAVADCVHFFPVLLNLPPIHNRAQIMAVVDRVMPCYRTARFSVDVFVEFCFLVAFWTLVIRERGDWSEAPQFALETITMVTRGVLNKGGFGACESWPTELEMRCAEVD